jgi:hemoglobin-like flavoprotein
MDADKLKLIRLSLLKIMSNKVAVGRIFYDRLFVIAPDTRALFKEDIDTQSRKLIDSLSLAISSVENPVALTAMLQTLATRHQHYGVTKEHYAKVGEALVYTLETAFGQDLTPQLRAAWIELYGAVSSTMMAAEASLANAARNTKAATG